MADISEGVIFASVDIASPAERVFHALTTDEILRWWNMSVDYRTTGWIEDIRVGGAWRAEGINADGTSSMSAASSSRSIHRVSSCMHGELTGIRPT